MILRKIDPTTNPLWSELVSQQKTCVFHTPMWLCAIQDTYGFEMSALVLVEEDKPVAGIAWATIEDAFGQRIASLPFSDFADPIVSNETQWCVLSQALCRQNAPSKLRCLHNTLPLNDSRWQHKSQARWHGIDLTLGRDALWENLHSSARRAIRKAESADFQVRIGRSAADVDIYYNLHVGVRKHKYRMLPQPRSFFQNIWHQLIDAGHGFVMIAEQRGRPIAATLFLTWQDTLTYKFNASHADFLELRPNDLIIWKAIEYGCANKLAQFDFGLSDWEQDGLVRYKRKFATEEKTIHFLSHQPDGWRAGDAQQLRPLFSELTDLFTDPSVPDDIAARAGDLLYRYFI